MDVTRVLVSVCPTGLRDFAQSLSANGDVVALIRPRCLPFASPPVHCLLYFTLLLDNVDSERLSVAK